MSYAMRRSVALVNTHILWMRVPVWGNTGLRRGELWLEPAPKRYRPRARRLCLEAYSPAPPKTVQSPFRSTFPVPKQTPLLLKLVDVSLRETLSQFASGLELTSCAWHQYFSSLERLRLAKDGVSPAFPARKKSLRDASRFSTRRKSLLDTSSIPLQQTLNPAGSRLRRRRARIAATTPVDADNAAWFASLPPAVRRKHFTREEQILFANERHSIILDAADELFHRRCRQTTATDPIPFVFPPRPQTCYFPDNADGASFFDDTESEQDDTEVDIPGMANYSVDKFPWLEEEPDLDLRLDDYHAAIAETALRQKASKQRRSVRRNLSLSTLSLRRSSISSALPTFSSVGRATPAPQFRPTLPPPTPSTRHASKASISSIDPQATHYQDPAARMKLRVYLASPSKFDEAVEFGFPSVQDKAPLQLQPDRPKTSPRLTNESGRTFFTDDTPSLLGDDGSIHDEIDTGFDPRTPEDTEFRLHRKSQKLSNERYSIRPQVVRSPLEQYGQSSTLDREMTIHMTLTRPDLRSPEESHSSQVNSRPLELAALPNSDKRTSIWDALPDDESKMKRFWRRLRLK